MRQTLTQQHRLDEKGRVAGGETNGLGLLINWQNGPVGGEQELEPNGAYVTGIIQAAAGRLQFVQETSLGCREYALALTKLEEALHWCESRVVGDEIEGTYAP